MKLKSLRLNIKDVENYGLENFYCTKFNNIIALVGKNGSGKTRYLDAIYNSLLNSDVTTDFDSLLSKIPSEIEVAMNLYKEDQEIYDIYKEMTTLNNIVNPTTENQNSLNILNAAYLNNHKVKLGKFSPKTFQRHTKTIQTEILQRLKIIKSSDLRRLQEGFDSKEKVSFQSIIDSTVESLDVNEFSLINDSAFSFLQRLPHKLAYDDIDCRGDDKKFKSRVSYKRFLLLKNLIFEFLDKDLEWHSENSDINEFDDHVNIKTKGYWTIDNRNLNYNDFSDGEKVLFTYAILLFLLNVNPRVKFSESIIIIDEPELNLHPNAQIKLLQVLEKLISDKGQLIIATHSLSIVANLDYGSIFLVKKNKLYPPNSSAPFNAVEELMGFEEHYNKITEFLVSTPSWAMTNFMAQCFEDPAVFDSASKNDPQLELFKSLLQEKDNLAILDYGSGQGRLLERLKESDDVWKRIESYDCFDPNSDFNDIVLEKGASIVINNLKELSSEKYDLVVVVNVLHEVHISQWKETLNKIKKSLKPGGIIAIIEDIELPIGELPNEIGFLLLGKEEMKKLFSEKINFLIPDQDRYKNRIICGLISKESFENITTSKIVSVLELLQKNSFEKIRNYRKSEKKEASLGRLYALQSNLYVNSQLAINHLIETESLNKTTNFEIKNI